jgi:hypothetical protein
VPAVGDVVGLEDGVGGGHAAKLPQASAKVNSGTSYFLLEGVK